MRDKAVKQVDFQEKSIEQNSNKQRNFIILSSNLDYERI